MASNTTATLSPSEFIERNSMYAINLVLSVFGIISNATIVLLICKNPHLRRNCKYLQAALASGDAVLCFGQFTNQTMNLFINNLSLRLIRWLCLLLSTHGTMAIMYSMIMTVFIALDRFLAITFPLKYRNLPKLKTCLCCASVALLTSATFAVVTYTDVNLHDYPAKCLGDGSRSPSMSGLINNFSAVSGIIVLIVYPLTLFAMRYKMKNLTNQNDNQSFLKQVEVTRSITYVVTSSLIIYVIPNLLLLIMKSYNLQPIFTSKAPTYVASCLIIHTGLNCVFYLWKDKKMREAFFKLFPNRITSTIGIA